MGWTHDYGDTARNRRSARSLSTYGRGDSQGRGVVPPDQELPGIPGVGIPRILRRRARWVSARLRHPRG
ncbi:hypothetical protein [Streptomyces sp. NPDC050504]|uniref:hypothetical protein n=1 Tax=Streptomyces sp. NPDC050504 TaxID=3365618 RepID=UPI0037B2662E